MKLVIISILLTLNSCKWLDERALNAWTEESVELLLKMSLRKSMINDTPLKTMEELSALPNINLSPMETCRCAESLYGGFLTIVANDVKESSVKSVCKRMGNCFFKGEYPEDFLKKCINNFKKSGFKKLARDRNKSLKRFTRARRLLGSHCSKI